MIKEIIIVTVIVADLKLEIMFKMHIISAQ